MFIQTILNRIFDKNENSIFSTDNPRTTFTKPNKFSSDQLQTTLLTPPSGKQLFIKQIMIFSEGTSGIVSLERGNGIPDDPEINTDRVFEVYLSTAGRTSAEVSELLEVDESLDLEIVGVAGGKPIFIIVTVRYIDPQNK